MRKKILVVAATVFELQPTLNALQLAQATPIHQPVGMTDTPPVLFQSELPNKAYSLSILVTGVGLVNTMYALSQFAQASYDWVINAGVAGAFQALTPSKDGSQHPLSLGQVVEVTHERYADFGAETADGDFLDFFQTDLVKGNTFPFEGQGQLINPKPLNFGKMAAVSGITVQTVHGYAPSIMALQTRHPDAQVETMEGAAFFEWCLRRNVQRFTQIRAISNYVEPRNRANWQMKKAIENLNTTLELVMRYE